NLNLANRNCRYRLAFGRKEGRKRETDNRNAQKRRTSHGICPGETVANGPAIQTLRVLVSSAGGGDYRQNIPHAKLCVYTSTGFSKGNCMFSIRKRKNASWASFVAVIALALEVLVWQPVPGRAQNQSPSPNQQDSPPAAGGPQSDVGPYAIPKKKEEPPPPPPDKPKKIEGMPDYSIHVDVPLVNVDVMVTTKDGQFISNLKKENFRVS